VISSWCELRVRWESMRARDPDPNGVLEALYATDLSAEQWLRLVTERIRPLMDRDGLGMVCGLYSCPDPCSFVLSNVFVCDVSESLQTVFFDGLGDVSPVFVAHGFLGRSCFLGSDVRGWSDISTVRNGAMKDSGAVDCLHLNVVEPDGQGCWFSSPLAERIDISDDAYLGLTRVGRHLAAGHRLRRKSERATIDNRPGPASIDLLSPREREVVVRAWRGQHNKLIAHEMGLAHSTVRVLLARAATKVGASSRRELLDMVARGTKFTPRKPTIV
jgi:DNA-binding CsgD family transcriptional regulator